MARGGASVLSLIFPLFCSPYLPVILGASLLSFAAGIVIEEKNWPPFFPIIHHDINNEIPVHLQRTQYVAFASLLGMFFVLFAFSITSAQSDILTAKLLIYLYKSNDLCHHHPASVMRRFFVILTGKVNIFACLFGRVDHVPVLELSLCYSCLG